MNKPLYDSDFGASEPVEPVSVLVTRAGTVVPPLWPLESAIAVNPVAGFEDQPFDQAVEAAARIFEARQSLPLQAWRKLLSDGKISEKALRNVVVERLGGFDEAFVLLGANVSLFDFMIARLKELPPRHECASRSKFDAADALVAKWCGAFFAEKAVNLMRNRTAGLYAAVLPLLAVDPELTDIAGRQHASGTLLGQDADPMVAIEQNLMAINLPVTEWQDLLERLVARLPGWAGHIRWRVEYAAPDRVASAPSSIAHLLALWTTIVRAAPQLIKSSDRAENDCSEALLNHFAIGLDDLLPDEESQSGFKSICALSEDELGLIFMRAAEQDYREGLLDQLKGRCEQQSASTQRADAQLIFCIDVRSEPMRRTIEAKGNYETFGYAGFFGVPVAVRPLDGGPVRKLLPVLLQPSHEVSETADQTSWPLVQGAWQQLLSALKDGLATAFTTAEASGVPAAIVMAARTFFPRRIARQVAHRGLELDMIPLAEQISYAKGLFDLTGISQATSRLVLLVGHAGCATNNPFASALHCGACGGHPGGGNARMLASMLNNPAVRRGLAAEGVHIAEDTLFVPAEHDTTCDEVTIFDKGNILPMHRAELARLDEHLASAGVSCRQVRSARLGRTPADLVTGSAHWGEVRPEWGLAGNAAFIVGPRSLTANVDLEGRAFLHSYDWRSDQDGSSLTTILTAPMVVAQWINCQYLFSTVNNDRFGAGDKVTHNVLGGIGVVQGNGGDLQVGLPRQSLFSDDGSPFHIPQRLLTVVYAPPERIEAVIESQPILQKLFENEWVLLVSMDPRDGRKRSLLPQHLSQRGLRHT